MDLARFRYDEQVSYLEIYYLVNDSKKIENEDKLFLNLQILDAQKDSLLGTQDFQVTFDKNQAGSGSTKLGLIKTLLPEGQYSVTMSGYINSKDQPVDSIGLDTNIKPFVNEKITLSDIELCNNIVPHSKKTDDMFYKNTMEVIPNTAHIYTKDNSRLYYYMEIYNLEQNALANNELQLKVVIVDGSGQIRREKSYHRPQKTESLVEIGAFDVSNMETGLYALIFAVTDSASNYSVYRRSQFYMDNPDLIVVADEENEEQKFMQSQYFRMDGEMLDKYFEQASYVASQEEISIYKSLVDAEKKKRFLFDFWNKRNKANPGTEDEYYAKVEHANESYTSGGVEGWKTDMGRVYIVYGKPDQIDRKPNTPATNPYEIWHYYDIQGGVEFDFVDDRGFGQYKLVNSTHRSEIQERDWVKWFVEK